MPNLTADLDMTTLVALRPGGLARGRRVARSTGAVVSVYDRNHPAFADLGIDQEFSGRYVVRCENHGGTESGTYAEARNAMAKPETFCLTCSTIAAVVQAERADDVDLAAAAVAEKVAEVKAAVVARLADGLVAKGGKAHRATCKRLPEGFVSEDFDADALAPATCCKPKGALIA